MQSWTMAAMVALGELEPVDVALNSDTTWERQDTYRFAAWATPWLEERRVKVVTVKSDVTGVVNKWGHPEIPAYHTYPDGSPSGMLHRQCTQRWKIDPMKKWLTEELKRLGKRKGPGAIEQWIGITLDEVERAKDSSVQWQIHRFPLLEKKMTRIHCIQWLEKNGLPVPPKSSCVFCPYHTRSAWTRMKQENLLDWQIAIEADEKIRRAQPGYIAYVHPDRIPLSQIKIAGDFGAEQMTFDLFNAECDSGYCFL